MVGQRYIVVGDSTEYIPVIDAYAFTYDYGEGKTVLRVEINSDVKTFDELKALFAEDVVIDEYEDKERPIMPEDGMESGETEIVRTKTFTFKHFCKDYKCDYNSEKDVFELEITRKSDAELEGETNQNQVLDAYEAVAAIYEME